ncbi:adenylate/guanylate cyclase domain-containing protein [Phormidium sp. CCY1219]|uniref:adenylate/guanylate cyclase domain-containing protein n=1 Tax=Phormidium sp. CCY1219 TaxID=2886104 RepID=UPI002D1F5FAA|nr:adenylate/guanylate cyclase domain-containing protein [Phormidium sp. CCY1219]MEB3829913.1 HAMP domain-containing protein [Phormidium sp. CCY1219]
MTVELNHVYRSKPLRRKWKMPLRLVLVVPFVLQICAAVGLTGWLSLQNGQEAVNDLATQLREEISARIEQRLREYLQAPRVINQINVNDIQLGQVNLDNTASLTRQFWHQRDLFSPISVSAIYFGAADGEFTGLGFQNNNRWEVGRAGKSTEGKFHSYAIDSVGNPTELLEVGGDYDPRIRPWYENAVNAGKSTWSDIYVDFKDPRLKITLVEPIYRDGEELRGVLGVDFVLSHIRLFLEQLKIGKSGETFIVERSGFLVATSAAQKPFVMKGDRVERVKAVAVENPLIRESARFLTNRFGSFASINWPKQLTFKIDNEPHYLQVVPFSEGENLDWLIVVVVPEADFMDRIHANTRTTIKLCSIALCVAMGVGVVTARWISKPIWRLNQASLAIANGNFEQQVSVSRPDELNQLAKAFNRMSAQLKSSHEQLADYSRSLEYKVQERTQELQLEKEKSERLLLNILPGAIAEQLKHNQSAIADYFPEATILFADIVGFTKLSARVSPIELVSLLNQIFSTFDQLAEKHGLEKIKTIGDAYMVVGGLPLARTDHAESVAEMALEMQAAIHTFQVENEKPFQIRIGINTGPVVAGVIGIKKFIYDLWGDTVNVASRMESAGIPGKIQVTAATYEQIKEKFFLQERGSIVVKGKGKMKTYWLVGKKQRNGGVGG